MTLHVQVLKAVAVLVSLFQSRAWPVIVHIDIISCLQLRGVGQLM